MQNGKELFKRDGGIGLYANWCFLISECNTGRRNYSVCRELDVLFWKSARLVYLDGILLNSAIKFKHTESHLN